MEGAIFLLIMLGVGWLVIWCCVDHSKLSRIWWPFDLRSRDMSETGQQRQKPQVQQARVDPPRPWQRRAR